MARFKKPGCEKPFGRSEYVQFIPACMRDEIDPSCATCNSSDGDESTTVSPTEPNLDFPLTRLVIDRSEIQENSLNKLGSIGLVRIIPTKE